MRILFAGGGTAGHINPALAIAGYVREQEPDAQILYVGAKGGMEERLVPQAGFAFQSIVISGFQRKVTLQNIGRNLKTVVHLFSSTAESKKIIQKFQPDICVGTGGYVSGPVIREALKLHIPAVIHEQNAFPGVTNKALSKNADRVMLANADAQKYMAKNARFVLTGNPVRMEVIRADRTAARRTLHLDSRPLILSFGGSLGARKVNEAVLDLITESAKTDRFQHIHAYGQYGGWFPQKLEERGVHLADHPNFDIRPYIDNMPECLAAADLVICRAGAITLSELQAKGRAAIIIPSPNVAENHQYYNAMSMVNRGAGVILEEKDLTGAALVQKVRTLFEKPDTIPALAVNARKMAILDTNARIYAILQEVLKERKMR
ncbi:MULTISPECIES: undecaprenyldiphospho-muramoylpentapeptide beta-N-acetylglucosaminyltransferase [Caproicibacterium]|jgi:UDP-N-acetylglucosamine--N-acetylmuramyl-(pentapeptide) pyrophosphoryl-undecaprenol N-acetylglucosamine transferase|uniref:UDP-N-acetylglucosamine--N-acetylmuramyl-(pentapeptide) pyrophosphoryl-undecaprenol N-acetylglucosamine transferase n=1 Tax=Caproicibacterium lactatifermentans TaxID=2666138 RepID=A0A859DTN8_9FIRM|nr:undecaprenyldiphospho-muramoylpentapeptide beta-N-acetylglucosaminyltransferase [Caproicibacterium lactatifermentans]ARP50696.1 undecaprenyldiphospho-muramoylpentapeptide beta-N-acetylglucosaminyltransferase [Ruminococcaceae bacterium CPB6]MDD4807579.1 undecaprenyldiphospho-muramoylpentapeptide beta-N-acetylglucosaminyltransferase [Oscillospiraceae bacterium]QKN23573.1 undecaprenyldiphospho-muramoylpentapeptide beta-N-acetylglucosaminyltransferase [Caproicibacterium lactatifermentans]QKO2975